MVLSPCLDTRDFGKIAANILSSTITVGRAEGPLLETSPPFGLLNEGLFAVVLSYDNEWRGSHQGPLRGNAPGIKASWHLH